MQRHLWPALQRRFADQLQPSMSPDRLLRGLCVVPLEGQEESAVWTLGFREVGTCARTPSLSRDFTALASMVDPDVPCYLLVYVGDAPRQTAAAAAAYEPGVKDWALISYVPASSSSYAAKKMADNRAGLKAGLGADNFVETGMWCVDVGQITLSGYMRAAEAATEGDGPAAAPSSSASPVAGRTRRGDGKWRARAPRRRRSRRARPPDGT